MGSGHPDEAIVAWSKAVALVPDYAEAYMNLGIAYQSKDMPDSARTVWTRALGVKSDLVVARVALARLEAGEGRKDEAIQYYQDILDMGGKDPRLYAELGLVYEQYEQFDLAISNYEAAVALDPASAELQTALYRVKSKKQDREAARQANKIRVRQIVVRSQSEAEAILTQLNTGVDFIELARTKSIDPSGANGGDLGFFGPGEMIPTFEEAAMGLRVGEVSDVIRTSLGFHIIKRIE
jgi:tetratricopeptide (TPR) repeat protein